MRKEFRVLVSVEEALKTLFEAVKPAPLGVEEVPLLEALGRVLAEDVASPLDIPPFDRAAMDGYAVRAEDVEGADEWNPITLKVVGSVEAGDEGNIWVGRGEAVEVATGAAMPMGADSVVKVEYILREGDKVKVLRAVPRGAHVYPTGSDIPLGEVVLHEGTPLGPAEIGVLASLGLPKVRVYKAPDVAVISVGNELVMPGNPLPHGKVYDVNSYSIAGAVARLGCRPKVLGVYPDDPAAIRRVIAEACRNFDVVITSGGTSAGRGDYVYRVLGELGEVLVHGLKIKPGKPTVIAVVNGKPVIGLPGYPLSAMMAFELICRPLLEAYSGLKRKEGRVIEARLASRVIPEKGRVNLIPVCLRVKKEGLLAYPLRVKSGAIEALLLADAFLETSENEQYVERGEVRKLRLLKALEDLPDITGIGSHCMALEIVLGHLRKLGYKTRYIAKGSTAAFTSVRDGVANFGGTHLYDPASKEYNVSFMEIMGVRDKAVLVKGYMREQGFIVRPGNPLEIRSFLDIVEKRARFINRTKGSGTRALIDELLKKVAKEIGDTVDHLEGLIPGFNVEVKTHTAVAAAVKNGRADVGVGIRAAAAIYGLDFVPIGWERYDFLVEKESLELPVVKDFIAYLKSEDFKRLVEERLPGYKVPSDVGAVLS